MTNNQSTGNNNTRSWFLTLQYQHMHGEEMAFKVFVKSDTTMDAKKVVAVHMASSNINLLDLQPVDLN